MINNTIESPVSRRQFVKRISALAGFTAINSMLGCSIRKSELPVFISCASNRQNEHFVVAFTQAGILSQTKIPVRGHDCIPMTSKANQAVVIGRRPDTFAAVIDIAEGKIIRTFASEAKHHFYGHGRLICDDQYLVTTENAYEAGDGYLVVRDTESLKVLNRCKSGGIGPHDIAVLPNSQNQAGAINALKLVVANGGILTHPDYPRIKLNIDSMQSNISIVNLFNGEIENHIDAPNKAVSLRHVDVNENQQIVVAGQHQHKHHGNTPLVFSAIPNDEYLQPFDLPSSTWQSMKGYTASAKVSSTSAFVSSPRGHKLYVFDLASNALAQTIHMRDVAGLINTNKSVYATSGKGKVLSGIHQGRKPKTMLIGEQLMFDNHAAVSKLTI
ncbi:DUF1513 domain-containing protein [Agaribacter marinus]|uniref:DUF1513 domain-containing protein n=1 Tax=Agaribacter marinus TaxID=1431249 RepID=A0AA37SVI9_9ALTE|nr:DUF1513 domain-containing protein [Agaribacter marinus]GLR69922.1 hypothetical protein GCM10007852_08300 [Agaribacter marinus]